MRCAEFLERYSDYRDGLITDPGLLHRVRQHVVACPQCMAYDARIARGALLLRSVGAVQPSPEFRHQLRRRLAVADAAVAPITLGSARLMAALALAAVAALLAWAVWTPAAERFAAATPPGSSPPAVLANPRVPIAGVSPLVVPAFGDAWRAPGATDVSFGMLWSEPAP